MEIRYFWKKLESMRVLIQNTFNCIKHSPLFGSFKISSFISISLLEHCVILGIKQVSWQERVWQYWKISVLRAQIFSFVSDSLLLTFKAHIGWSCTMLSMHCWMGSCWDNLNKIMRICNFWKTYFTSILIIILVPLIKNNQ